MKYIYNPTTGEVILAVDTIQSEYSVPYNNENFLKPKINLETLELYESATQEEILEANKPKVPEKVKKANFKLALIKLGISTNAISNAIYSMPDTLEKDKTIVLWEDTEVFYRNDESLNNMAPNFNITQEQLNQIFILAEKL